MKLRKLLTAALLAIGVLPLENLLANDYFNSADSDGAAATFVSAAGDSADPGVCGTCGDCDDCDGERLLGLIAPSDACFGFISPMTNPVFFEDPRTLTEARFIYLRHKVPGNVGGGGDVELIACQLRAALTERLSVIATKDGYIMSSNALIDDGWADVSAGLKYNLFADPEMQRILSAGVTYELPVGSQVAQQGNGDGLFNLFLSAGTAIGDNNHWISATGLLLPTDNSAESQIWFWSNHFDRRLGNSNLFALAEVNWYHWMNSGDAFAANIEGGDLFNLGSTDVAGNDIVTGAFGVKYSPSHKMELGVAWEVPLTERRDVLDNRLTVDAIFRY